MIKSDIDFVRETGKSRVEAFQSTIWKESWQATQFNPRRVHELNGRLVSEETVIPRRCGSETLKFAIKQVNKGQISTATET